MGSDKMGSGPVMLKYMLSRYMNRSVSRFWIVWQDLFCLAEGITNYDMCDTVKILYRDSCIANIQISTETMQSKKVFHFHFHHSFISIKQKQN